MLENERDSECNNLRNVSSLNIDYLKTTEFKMIKKLISEDDLEYMTDYLRDLLKVSKENNPDCFVKKAPFDSLHNHEKRGIMYVRLSQEDLDKEEGNVSKSILNQILMLLSYCNDKKIKVVGIFYEEDISGSDRSRIEWNKTLRFCELGNTDIYICKTQARFARSIEFVEKYLHKKFIEWNIRFLSIVDNIDTFNKGNKKSSQITAMVDEWKLEEQSINTKKTLRAKNDAGQWTGSFAPYGYMEDPDDMYHLIVDEEAAKVVREIYSMYANGYGYYKICQCLNERKIPTPSKYKKLHGLKFVCGKAPNGAEFWNTDTIKKILLDETYDGILIQHRTEKVAYNIKRYRKIPRNEQSIIACAHDRIVDSDVSNIVRKKFTDRKFKIDLDNARKCSTQLICYVKECLKNLSIEKVKSEEINTAIKELENDLISDDIKLITNKYDNLRDKISTLNNDLYSSINDKPDVFTTSKSRSRPGKNGDIHIFSRKVYCAVCGKAFQKNNSKSGSKEKLLKKAYLHCGNHKKTGGIQCDNNGYISYDVLEQLVLNEINKIIKKYYRTEKIEKYYSLKKQSYDCEKDIIILENEKKDIEKKLNKKNEHLVMLYEDKIEGIITTDEFVILKSKYQKDVDNFGSRIKEIEKEINRLNIKKTVDDNKNNILKKYTCIKKLNRLIVDNFIEKILIGKKDDNNNRFIKIFWDFNI